MATEQDFQSIKNSVEEVVTYPVLTRETQGLDASGGGGGGYDSSGYPGDSLTRTAQQTLRDLLGWRVRSDDPKGFLAALNKTVTLKEVEGHVEWTWTPSLYLLQSDLGEVTGAQASVHKQASVAVEQALPLLDGLKPLRADADTEDTDAMRAIIRTELQELVSELALSGGPRVMRIDSFFERLLSLLPLTPGAPPVNTDPELVQGELLRLRDRFGLQRERVNTVLEEQNLTNFLILVDYVYTLYNSWQSKRNYFLRNGAAEPFLGTQLVLVSQALDVVAEQVRETYAAMDSVFFGPAERQVTTLNLPGEAPITVAELLDWVETFATKEGRQLIQEGGKDGVVILRATSERLARLVEKAAVLAAQPSGNPSRPFHTKRVANPLAELATYLAGLKNRAAAISRRPFRLADEAGDEENLPLPCTPPAANSGPLSVISKIDYDPAEWQLDPTSPTQPQLAKLRFIGSGLAGGFSPEFLGAPGLKIIDMDVERSGEIATSTVRIDPSTPPGFWDVRVKNSAGIQKTFTDAVELTEPVPVPDPYDKDAITLEPDFGHQGQTLDVMIQGGGVGAGAGLRFARDIQVYRLEYPDKGGILATLKIPRGAAPGKVAVEVFIADCRQADLPKPFCIRECPDEPVRIKITTQCDCVGDLPGGPCHPGGTTAGHGPGPTSSPPGTTTTPPYSDPGGQTTETTASKPPAGILDPLNARAESLNIAQSALKEKVKELIAETKKKGATKAFLATAQQVIASNNTLIAEWADEAELIFAANSAGYVCHTWAEPYRLPRSRQCAIPVGLDRGQGIRVAYLLPKGDSTAPLKHTRLEYRESQDPAAPLTAVILFDTSASGAGEYDLIKLMEDGSVHHVPLCVVLS